MKTIPKKLRALILLLFAVVIVLTSVCVFLVIDRIKTDPDEPQETAIRGNGLFSWHDEVLEEEEQKTLFRLMRQENLTELYQDIPSGEPVPKIRAFAEACEENGIRLYLLIGEPEWALDENAVALRSQIQRAALMGFAGVMIDVEPGSTDEWKEDRSFVMQTMTKAFLRGKTAAEENGLETIVCLSYYYDDYGFEDELETIVKKGCDALAIMNYDRENETGQIETEAALCKTYGKRLIHIYELQEVGKYGLEESHTYREAGLDALKESFDAISRYFSGQSVTMALHAYRDLKSMADS